MVAQGHMTTDLLSLSLGFGAVRTVHSHPLFPRRLAITPEASVALVESFWGKVWAACDPAAIDRFVTEDFIITSAGVDITGPGDFKTWVAGFQSRIADLRWETIETFSDLDGSRVASRFRITGRNNGMLGLPADGKSVAFAGTAIFAVTPAGKLARNWVERS